MRDAATQIQRSFYLIGRVATTKSQQNLIKSSRWVWKTRWRRANFGSSTSCLSCPSSKATTLWTSTKPTVIRRLPSPMTAFWPKSAQFHPSWEPWDSYGVPLWTKSRQTLSRKYMAPYSVFKFAWDSRLIKPAKCEKHLPCAYVCLFSAKVPTLCSFQRCSEKCMGSQQALSMERFSHLQACQT